MQRAKQEEKRSSANRGGNKPASSSSDNVRVLPADEWFAKFKEGVLDQPGTGNPVDGLMRNTIRLTAEIRTRQFGALKSLLGKNLVWLQLVLIDEKRSVQGKLHGIGAKVMPNDQYVAERSSRLFRILLLTCCVIRIVGSSLAPCILGSGVAFFEEFIERNANLRGIQRVCWPDR
ncbi:hypothetical protein OROMI_030392 [Orobanche minor]